MFSPLQLQLSHPYWHEKCHVHLLLFSASCIGPGQSSWGIGQAIHWANHSGTRAASPPLSAWSNGTNPILKSWTDAIAAIQKNQVFSFGALNIGGFGMAYLFFLLEMLKQPLKWDDSPHVGWDWWSKKFSEDVSAPVVLPWTISLSKIQFPLNGSFIGITSFSDTSIWLNYGTCRWRLGDDSPDTVLTIIPVTSSSWGHDRIHPDW